MRPSNHEQKNDIRKKIEDYSYGLSDMIGKGFNSVIFAGANEITHQKVAIKVIDIKSIKQDKLARDLLEVEIEALRKLNHINILKCYDVYSTVNNCYIITEFCNEGDLDNLLKVRGKLQEQEAISLFRDIFLGIRYLGQNCYCHKDLKPKNIFIKEGVAKIGDLGFYKKENDLIPQRSNLKANNFLYMSPQALLKNNFTIKNDIWSLGVILYQMLHGKTPWQAASEKQILEKIMNISLYLRGTLSQELRDFLKQCLTIDEHKRISFSQLSSHLFVKQIMMQGDIPKFLRKPTFIEPLPQNDQKLKPIQKITKDDCSTQKQLQSQINWMRFLYRVNQMFPSVSKSSRVTMGLRFIVVKQMLSQLQSLRITIQEKENVFGFQNWSQFFKNNQKFKKYQEVIIQYSKKYKNCRALLEEWIKVVELDERLRCIADSQFIRSQNLSLLGINYVLQQIKTLWDEVQKQSERCFGEDLPDQLQKKAIRVDFLITYYQLNCLLIDNFYDPDYFGRVSKIQLINQYKPYLLQKSHILDIHNKLNLLGISL